MGRPKAWLPWFGRTLIEHVVGVVKDAVDEVVVVTSEALDLPVLPAKIVRDREPERGPLAGIRDGLAATRAARSFVTATDAPFLRAAYIEELFGKDGACAPQAEGHVQVLSAIYPREAAEMAARLLDSGARRPLDLLEACEYEALEPATLRSVGTNPPWRGFNTPRAYLGTVREIDPAAEAEVELLGRAAIHAEEPIKRLPIDRLGSLLGEWPASLGLIEDDRVAKGYLVSLGGRQLTRDLDVPIGPGERVSVIDALAGG